MSSLNPIASDPLATVSVLVVDDDAHVRDFLTDALEMHGATVTAVDTAQDALEALKAWRPDVLVSDLQMPGKDGYWLIAEVRALAPERGGMTPAACLSGGLVAPEDRAQALQAGFQFHLAKPVQLEMLIGIVGAARGRSMVNTQPVPGRFST